MKIHIPNSAFLGNIESFVSKFDPSNPSKLEVTSNEDWISIHPVVVSMVIALADEVKNNSGKINCESFTAKSKSYLIRMGLIESLIETIDEIQEHEPSGRFIKTTRINTSDELHKFITDMVPLLHATPEQVYPIKYVMSELVRNVIEHSRSDIGAIVTAQYFKKTNRISIGVVDRGIGIKTSLDRYYPTDSDKQAISLALKPGVTGTTRKIGGTEFNAGAGLFFTKSIAKVSKNFFFVYSGDSFYKLHKTPIGKQVRLYVNPEQDKSKFATQIPYWQGTAVGIDISMDMSQEFDALLEMIRRVYHLDVKQTKKAKYKKPKFQ